MKQKKRRNIFRKIKRKLNKMGTLNIILICVGLFFIWFNAQMIEMFKTQGALPEAYACAVIAATIGECGICGWIRTNKDRKQQRKWDKEDQKENGMKGD